MTHPIDMFVPSRAPTQLGVAFGANQPLALEQKLEGGASANSPKLEVSVVKLEGRSGRLFVLKHLEARCDQPLSAYRTFLVGTAGYSSHVFIQPAEMNPQGVPRCNSLYTVSFYVDGDVSEISYRGDFYGDPASQFKTIWALDWTHTSGVGLGSAISCAKGVVLPANFMTTGQQNPVPHATPGTAPATTARSALPWVLGAVAVGGLAWWAWSSGALASAGIAANPKRQGSAPESRVIDYVDSYALNRGLKAEFPRLVVGMMRELQGWPVRNADGGANIAYFKSAEEAERAIRVARKWFNSFPRANPRGDTVNAVVRKAGWSFDLAMSALKSDGAARWHNGLLYVLTDDSGDTIPSDPREPMIVGVYALDEREGEWIEVGMKDFPDLRGALQRWNTVQIDLTVVRELGTGIFKPNPAARSSAKRDEADAREMADALQHNADAYVRGEIDRDTFDTRARQYWETVDAAGIHERVLRIWRKRNPAPNPGRAQKLGVHPSDVDPKELARGTKHELEHTDSRKVAARIALDHLAEDEHYYEHLDAMERSTFRGNPRYKTRAAFSRRGKWGWVTWTHQEPNKHAAIIAKGRELGAEGWDFGNADHYSVSDYPAGRGF